MAWPHLDGMIKVVVTYGFDGEPSVNVHFVYKQGGGSPIPQSSLETVAAIFQNAIFQQWAARMGDEWSVEYIVATDWSIENGGQYSYSNGIPFSGQETIEEVPASVALVVSTRTAKTGRSYRGRTYLPGLTEATVIGNHVTATGLVTAAAYYTLLVGDLQEANFDLVVYSLYSGGAPRATPVQTPIETVIINSRVDTQRRRLPA